MEYSFRERYYVYIVTDEEKKEFDIDVCGDLYVRLQQLEDMASEKIKPVRSKLLYWECYEKAEVALAREKTLNKLSRKKIIKLIGEKNPSWQNLIESEKDIFYRSFR